MAFSLSIPIPIPTPTPTRISLGQSMDTVVQVVNEPFLSTSRSATRQDRRREIGAAGRSSQVMGRAAENQFGGLADCFR
jgi:hypothetical protein